MDGQMTMPRKAPILLVALTFVVLTLAGCHEPTPGDGPPSFTYTAENFSFDGPDELPAGWVHIIMENQGSPHHMQFLRLDEGRTAAEFHEHMAEAGVEPEWVTLAGGPNTPGPGGQSEGFLELEAGDYLLICVIPEPDGTTHYAHGMHMEVRVVDEDNDAEPPAADLQVSLVDFAFEPAEEWTAGEQMVAVQNDGNEPHELVLVRYHENGNFSSLLQALGPNATGPPPADFLGGTTGLAVGARQSFPVDLEAGRYGFICFLPSPANGGAPHFALGMEQEFQVGA